MISKRPKFRHTTPAVRTEDFAVGSDLLSALFLDNVYGIGSTGMCKATKETTGSLN